MCRASRAENLLSSWSRAFCSPPSWGSQPSKRWAGPARPQMAAPAQPHLPPHPTPVRRSLPLTQTPRRTGASRTDGEKIVYLAFDERGPSKNTQRVLDILDQYGAKATFFVVGHDPDYYDMIEEGL